jgi:uncharacterized protein
VTTERRAGFGRWVCDTNVLISALLRPQGTAGRAFGRAVQHGKLLVSQPTLAELHDVLFRPKFDRYVSHAVRSQFLADLMPLLELVPASAAIRACRDPKDDKFLEVAVHGNADALISGDEDLLLLHPFHGVPFLAPAAFIARFESSGPGDDEAASAPVLQEPRAAYAVRAKAKPVRAPTRALKG